MCDYNLLMPDHVYPFLKEKLFGCLVSVKTLRTAS